MSDETANKQKRYREEDVERLSGGLASLPEKKKSDLSKREVIARMADEIQGAMERGYSLEDIHAYLNDQGFDLNLNTLRTYYGKTRTKKGRKQKNSDQEMIKVTKTSKNTNKIQTRKKDAAFILNSSLTSPHRKTPKGFCEPDEDY